MKRKNGNYRVREMYNGKSYSITYQYKPTQKEAQKDLNELIESNSIGSTEKMSKCFEVYVNSKLNILSPSTIRTCKRYIKSIPDSFLNISIKDITSITIQQLINNYSINHEPKTTKAFFGFVRSVINCYSNVKLKITLPPQIKKDVYIPTKEDMEIILSQSENTPYYIPLLLASYGMRFGEIKALTLEDVLDGKIRINKTLVYDENYTKVIKQPKTYESTRTINVPAYITDLIKENKIIYDGSNSAINRYLYKIQRINNIPKFSIHKLRHFFATELHNRNIPSKYIQAMGGWATDNILKTIYTHTNKELETINFFD